MESKCCPDKLSQYQVGGLTKPFIDKNLQIHLPFSESHQNKSSISHSPIYSHYHGTSSPSIPLSSSLSSFSSLVNENELNQAMSEAERSYEAWKKMEQKLREAASLPL